MIEVQPFFPGRVHIAIRRNVSFKRQLVAAVGVFVALIQNLFIDVVTQGIAQGLNHLCHKVDTARITSSHRNLHILNRRQSHVRLDVVLFFAQVVRSQFVLGFLCRLTRLVSFIGLFSENTNLTITSSIRPTARSDSTNVNKSIT